MNLINWETWIGIVFFICLAIFGISYIVLGIAYCYTSEKATKVMLYCLIAEIVTGVIIVGYLLTALITAIGKI